MARRAIVPATVMSSGGGENTPLVDDSYPGPSNHRYSYSRRHGRQGSSGSYGSNGFYGSAAITESPKTGSARWKSGPPIVIEALPDIPNEDEGDEEEEADVRLYDGVSACAVRRPLTTSDQRLEVHVSNILLGTPHYASDLGSPGAA